MTERVLCFGPFELYPVRAQLFCDGARIGIGSRALAILALLAERGGEVVSTQEIGERVWPNLFVQENNLRVHMSAIRRILRGPGGGQVEILNIPGRGYRLRADRIFETAGAGDAETAGNPLPTPLPLPLPIHRLIGRADSVAQIGESLRVHRLVTVVGPGGIGKTSVALAALAASGPDRQACFVDLANCSSIEHVTTGIAAALQSPMGSDATPDALIDRLRDATVILLLDNCEHLVDAIAHVVERVLFSCPHVTLLATSREPLRVTGERLVHIQPLPVPAVTDTGEAIAANPSFALFVERAAAATGGLTLDAETTAQIAAICRSLDGLPLALELAAASVPVLGLAPLASGLTERLSLLALGRRTLARHETLEAMLDWSFELLSLEERTVLAALGCFRSGFDLAAAVQVATLGEDREIATQQAVLRLAAKSLLVIERAPEGMVYRLLETTKLYARRKLEESGGAPVVARRHAEWVEGLLARAQDDWLALDRTLWWERYGGTIGDVRAALLWSLGEAGDVRLGIRLTRASAPLWLGMSQYAEYHRWLEQALATLAALGGAGGIEESQLQVGLCVLLFNGDGPREGFVRAATRILRIAEDIGDPLGRAIGFWLLSGGRGIRGDHPASLLLAQQMLAADAATADPHLRTFAMRVIALMTFRVGRIAESAAIGAELVANHSARTAYGAVLRYDHSTVSRGNHAVTLAVQGRLDSARALIEEAVADGIRLRNPSSFCYLLSSAACPVALWLGDDDLAGRYAALLAREAQDNRFPYMAELAGWFLRILDLRAGRPPRPLVLDRVRPPLPHDKDVFITTCAPLCDAEALARAEACPPHWATAEILRAHAESRRAIGEHAVARALLGRALSIAESQGAGLWALRAATGLARLIPPEEAAPLLETALARIEGGIGYCDVRAARALLGQLTVRSPVSR